MQAIGCPTYCTETVGEDRVIVAARCHNCSHPVCRLDRLPPLTTPGAFGDGGEIQRANRAHAQCGSAERGMQACLPARR